MLDDRIKLWQPGEVDIIGIPWHGLAQGPAHGTSGDYILTLPNGRQINLGSARRIGGGSYRYRDVRAVDPVLTQAEQDQATAAGAQWRADALLPAPHTGNWMYCDGQEGWRINIVYFTYNAIDRIIIEPMTTIGRNQSGSDYNNGSRRTIDVTQLSPPPAYRDLEIFDRSLPSCTDITLTGNRALIAITASGGLYSSNLTELWEVEITGPGATATATARLVWSFDDLLADYAETDTHPGGVQGYAIAGAPYWTIVSSNDDGAVIKSDFQLEEVEASIRGYQKPHTRIRTREYRNRVVGAYYEDGQIRFVKLELIARTLRSVTSLSGPAAVENVAGQSYVEKRIYGGGPEYLWPPATDVTTNPRYTVDTSLSGSLESSLEYVLRDNGVEVSRYEATAAGTHMQTITRSWIRCGAYNDYRDFDTPKIFPEGADSASAFASGSYTTEHDFDGVPINSGSHSESWTNGQTVQFGGYVSDVDSPVFIDKKRVWPITVEGGFRVGAFPAKYNNGMFAIMVRTEAMSGPVAQVHRVGNVACKGQAMPGMFTYNGIQQNPPNGFGLYGAYNAVTGERVRDTPGPCYYV